MMITTVEGLSMGGTWRLRIPKGDETYQGIVQSRLDLVEAQMSAWQPLSALCSMNAAPVGRWVSIPAETAFVIGAGLEMMKDAPQAFSILMGGAQAHEGFVPGRSCGISDNPAMLELDGLRVRRLADVAVDLNAIAKGYAADLVASSLIKAGQHDFLIEVAGDIVARGSRPDGLPWTVAMELPIPDRMIAARLIPLRGGAIATSGGYRRAIGARSHLMSPVTGQPLLATDASVAVVAATALQADGWATALAVLGPEKGLALAAKRGFAAAFIEQGPDGFIERGSPAMAELLDAALLA